MARSTVQVPCSGGPSMVRVAPRETVMLTPMHTPQKQAWIENVAPTETPRSIS